MLRRNDDGRDARPERRVPSGAATASVDTHVDRARDHARSERAALAAKRDAFAAFRDRVEGIAPESPSPSASTAGGGLVRDAAPAPDRRATVRAAFAETVRPHSVADVDGDESLLETVRQEFSEPIAVALAPATDAPFSPALKRAILAQAESRRTETDVTRRALDREASHLDDAAEAVDRITGWIVEADETPLTDLGFEGLRVRHETLARHRERCEDLATRRQSFLDGATGEGPGVSLAHRRLATFLYQAFPVDYPVLATVARLDGTCADCQRVVRRHLVRRA
jgi:hypothetical protein